MIEQEYYITRVYENSGFFYIMNMNEEQLKAYLKEHLSIRVDTDTSYGYGSDPNYETVTIQLVLDGEPIGESESFTYKS